MRKTLTCVTVLVLSAIPAAAQKIEKQTLMSGGVARSDHLFVPGSVGDKPAPLLVTLHGSGRDGRIPSSTGRISPGRKG